MGCTSNFSKEHINILCKYYLEKWKYESLFHNKTI